MQKKYQVITTIWTKKNENVQLSKPKIFFVKVKKLKKASEIIFSDYKLFQDMKNKTWPLFMGSGEGVGGCISLTRTDAMILI